MGVRQVRHGPAPPMSILKAEDLERQGQATDVWELISRESPDMPFGCQSMNIWPTEISARKYHALHGYGWARWCTVCFLCFLFLGSNALYALDEDQASEEPEDGARFELEEVVVTATRIEEEIKNIPRNVTVITSEDIEHATSNNVVDLIARESGMNLQSFFGHDKRAVVDTRGMGETAVSNVVVMVDGFRLNSPDLAGPDFSTIPLGQIERIEIVRGAGSVIYGDGAVGGVINIITKKWQKEPEGRLYASYGSYETIDGRASYNGGIDKLDFNVHADYYDSDGYRDNGFFQKGNAALRLGYDLTDAITLSGSAAYHDDEYGLPGPVSKEDVDSRKRRVLTDRPNDAAETTDKRFTGGIETDLAEWGVLSVNGGYRFRDNEFILGFTPLLSKKQQKGFIDEDTGSLDLGYVKEQDVWGSEHRFQGGLDYYKTDYVREARGQNERKNSKVESLGLFVTDQWFLRDDLTFHLGYRYNWYDGEFRTDQLQRFGEVKRWVNGVPFDREWKNDAFDVGIVYSLNPETTLFASYATSFRIPNVDELALAEEDLRPQEGGHIEIGSRHRIKDIAELSATLFQIKIKDEILFSLDPETGIQTNRNADQKTIRRGVELDVKVYPTDFLYLWGNYTYLDPTFEKTDTFIPLVPRHKATLGLEWQIFEPLSLGVTGTHVGSRYDGNDETNNRFEKLDAYQAVDAKLSYIYKDLKIFAGVNNIFDELYSTLAFSETYYPMPTRNFYGGVEWKF